MRKGRAPWSKLVIKFCIFCEFFFRRHPNGKERDDLTGFMCCNEYLLTFSEGAGFTCDMFQPAVQYT